MSSCTDIHPYLPEGERDQAFDSAVPIASCLSFISSLSPSSILFSAGLHLISTYPSFFFCYFMIFDCSLSPFLPSSSRLADFSLPSTPSQFLFSPCMTLILLVCLSVLSILALQPPLDSDAPGSPSLSLRCFLAALLSPFPCVSSSSAFYPTASSSPSLHPVLESSLDASQCPPPPISSMLL